MERQRQHPTLAWQGRAGDVLLCAGGVCSLDAVALNLAQPITLVMISANVSGFVMMFLSVHTIVVNRRFLPRELQLRVWREAALVLTALFYGLFVMAAVAGALGWKATARELALTRQ